MEVLYQLSYLGEESILMGQMNRVRGDWLPALLGSALAMLAAAALFAMPVEALATNDGRAHASIFGGSAAASGEWPWAAFILALDGNNNGFSCTGTVVAPTLVLTAGHCFEDILTGGHTPVGRYTVVTGSRDVRDSTTRQISKVVRGIVYPHFNRFKLHGDAALLVLATPTSAPAVALAGPEDAALFEAGLPALVAGWGLSRGASAPRQLPILRRARTFVQRRQFCGNHARVYYPFFNSASQLCTITPPGFGNGTCHGDSGGPALAFRSDGTPVQIGITSLGPADCNTRLPDVFTRVDRVSAWVAGWIAATGGGVPPPVAEP